MSRPYEIRYAELAVQDVKSLRAFEQRKVVAGIERHLLHEPTRTSKSRIKAMLQPYWSQYRLRIDDLRVYYDVDEAMHVVNVLRVLEKGSEPAPETPP